ncbi:MAG: hypothetical protein A2289_13440 [Deltaproteobacteria bacterium RIFOXYA12_FULL_58_15]|nr:MAG: hypothetical protein A2289_13440 [Deltaproteobacteria bacterium RIFOXYA12_FULL_58_15]
MHRDATVTVWPIDDLHMKINVGDGSPSVNGWQDEDAFRTGGAAYDFSAPPDVSGLSNAAPADLYMTCIHDDHSYSFPLPNGNYLVRLHMYDQWNSAGRAMDYIVEGVKVLNNFNPGLAGTVSVQSFGVTVSDSNGLQIIAEADGGDDVFESGIEILVAPDDDIVSPSVRIQSPSNNAHLSGEVTFSGVASDNSFLSRIEISIDGDTPDTAGGTSSWSYSLITNSLTDGEHLVTARAVDASGNSASDSIRVVTENGQSIHLVSPNRGTVWRAGTTASIQWSTINLANVMIMYSLDGGASYYELAQTVLDTDPEWGNYPWRVPNAPTERARILVQGYFGEAPVQSEVFAISANDNPVVLIEPTADLVATAGEPIDVVWSAEGVDFVLLEYSLEDGLEWSIIDVVKVSDEQWGRYEWLAPWVSTPFARVRAYVSDGASSTSDPFVIQPPTGLIAGDVEVERINISGHIPKDFGEVDKLTIQGRKVKMGASGAFDANIVVPVGVESVVVSMEVSRNGRSKKRLLRVDVTQAQPPIEGLEVAEDELRAFLGGKGGVLTWVDGGGTIQVLDFRGSSPQVKPLSSDIDCINPLISPDGTRILYSVGSASGPKLIRARDLTGGSPQQIGAGDVAYWHITANGEKVLYCDWSDKEDNGASGKTYLQSIEFGGTTLVGAPTVLHDRAMDAGVNGDGRWLGQVYNNLWAYDGLYDREYPPSSFFLDDGVPADHQTCNGSMAPDASARLMTLVIPHDWVRVFSYNAELDHFEMTSQFELPAGSQEWEFPEWSTHPGFFTAVLRGPDLKFSVYIGKVSVGTGVPELLRITRKEDNATYSHLFVAP